MAGVAEDEESVYTRSKVQPFSSTPRSEEWRSENESKRGDTSFSQLLSERLGWKEFKSLKVWRASLAELLGTAVFVFVIDTTVISSIETDTEMPNLLLSILVFVAITFILLATSPVSGGHINPAVTFSAMLVGLISPARAFIYILAQCMGGVVGALSLKAVISDTLERTFSLGGCTVSVIVPGLQGPNVVGIGTSTALWLEIICTFVFLYGSVWMAFDNRQLKAHGPIIVSTIIGLVLGLMVFVSTTVTTTKGYSGAGMNPARCLGPAIVRGGHLWDGHWVFWVGPVIAGSAFYLYTKIIPGEHFHAHYEFKYDSFTTLKVLARGNKGDV